MNNALIDTNILYDFFAKTTLNNESKKILETLQTVVISQAVIYELATGLKNILGSSLTSMLIGEIYDIESGSDRFKILRIDEKDEKLALEIMAKYDSSNPRKDYTMVDAILIAQAQHNNLILYTTDERMTHFDQKLAKIIKPY
jgi:predicted nucleic acid-binding protein